jgi:hypothetical protein
MYMTFGCSRSPVTVAVPNSRRSVVPGAFEVDPAAVPRAVCVGAGAAAGWEVLARGSPASDWAVALAGLAVAAGAAVSAAGAAVSAAGAGAGVEAAGCCALAALIANPSAKLKAVVIKFMRAPF